MNKDFSDNRISEIPISTSTNIDPSIHKPLPIRTPGSISSCAECEHCKHTLFSSCTNEELKIIHSEKSFRNYKKNQILYLEGEKAEGLHCIYSGKVKIIKTNREGKEQIVKIASAGMNIGHHALASDFLYSDSSIIMEDAVVCFIPKNTFLKISSENTKMNIDLLRRLSLDFMEAEESIKHMSFKPVRERMAGALLLLKKAYKHQGNGKLLISISRTDLASIVGTAKETITRLLAELRDEKIIHMQGREIIIIEWEKLKEISELYD